MASIGAPPNVTSGARCMMAVGAKPVLCSKSPTGRKRQSESAKGYEDRIGLGFIDSLSAKAIFSDQLVART